MSEVPRNFGVVGEWMAQVIAEWARLHQPGAEGEVGKLNGYPDNEK
jgi:hypothetical protein